MSAASSAWPESDSIRCSERWSTSAVRPLAATLPLLIMSNAIPALHAAFRIS
ncbi:hypothetical protein [Nannocystis pusilla]|uniref:hypothetical protein n=1 Tax=Nannocystis pusilla TaxID=889268 RepID=UPI003DA2FBE1